MDERGCQQKASFLAAGEGGELFIERRDKMHHVQNARDMSLDIVLLFAEGTFEEFPNGLLQVGMRDHLLGDADRCTFGDMDGTFLRFQITRNQFEDRALARAVLAHDRQLRILTDRKTRAVEHGLVMVVVEMHVLKPEKNVAVIYGGDGKKRVSVAGMGGFT